MEAAETKTFENPFQVLLSMDAKGTKKSDGPSFQVIRGSAIRTATKSFSETNNVPQKQVKVLDTHKKSSDANMWTFEVLVSDTKFEARTIYQVQVDKTKQSTPQVLNVEATDKRSL
jgi:hypothetical protein